MKAFLNLFLFLPLILLSGCFEIIEEVSLNPNGSGTLVLTINGNQSKEQLDKTLSKDSIYNFKVPTRKDIDADINNISNKLKSTKGISNVEITRDFKTYILTIKCVFSNANALNAAINNIWLLYDKKIKITKPFYTYSNNIFNRNFNYSHVQKINDKLGSEGKSILSKSSYTTIYRFQSEISTYTNTTATISKSKKAIIIKNNILDIVSGKKSIQNEIKLKP